MAKNPDGSTRYNPDGSVYITPVAPVTLNLDAHGNSRDPNTFVHYQSDPDFGTPIQAKAGGTYVVMGQRPSPPLPPANVCTFIPQQQSNSSSSSSNAHPMSAEFIEDTYDPELGYEKYDSPGDNPYISNYEPKQFGYMNDLSTLSPDELGYFKGNVKGLDDRQNSVENPGSFLNNYLLDNNLFREEVNKTPETKIDTITPQDTDLVRRDDELYGPYKQYSPEHYF